MTCPTCGNEGFVMLVDPAGVERKLACGEPACPVTKRRLEALYHAIVHKLKPPIIKGRPS